MRPPPPSSVPPPRPPGPAAPQGASADRGPGAAPPRRVGRAPLPCPLCGFDAPLLPCPHCGGAPLESSLRRRLRGALGGLAPAVWALPRGLLYTLTTPGVRRWLVAPFVVTLALLIAAWTWVYERLAGWLDASLPAEVHLDGLRSSSAGLPGWLERVALALVGALEWLVGLALALFTWAPLQWIGWFLLGSLVLWFAFSLVYEMLAGPFLDEIQARLEARWFGADPRLALARPNDLPPERCARWTAQAALASALLFLGLWFLPHLLPHAPPRWVAFLGAPLGFVPWLARDARYRQWLVWVVGLQGRAIRASLQASLVTGGLILLALPLYFVPLWGYPVFATVCGFATAVGLLDIPFERRDWTRRQRWRFLLGNLPAILVFGTLSGLLLAVPLIGPLLLVPSASLGGAWLVCRLDKGPLRGAAEAASGRSR